MNLTEVSAITAFQNSILKDNNHFSHFSDKFSNLDDKFDIMKTNEDNDDKLNSSIKHTQSPKDKLKDDKNIHNKSAESEAFYLKSLDKIDVNNGNSDSRHDSMFNISKRDVKGSDSTSNLFSNISTNKMDDLNGSSFFSKQLNSNMMVNSGQSSNFIGLGNPEYINKSIEEYVRILIYSYFSLSQLLTINHYAFA